MEKKTENFKVFFDFDNTITTFDILDDMLVRFSEGNGWKALEDRWQRGEIGSKECLEGQVGGLRVNKGRLDKYLSDIKIDPYFKPLLGLLVSRGLRPVIISDNFDYIVKRVLEKNGVGGLPIYSNSLEIKGDRLIPGFPYSDKSCGDCGNCKKSTLVEEAGKGTCIFYVGDGKSDVCAAEEANIVFAKDYLREYCASRGLAHVPINDMSDVYNYFDEGLRNGKEVKCAVRQRTKMS